MKSIDKSVFITITPKKRHTLSTNMQVLQYNKTNISLTADSVHLIDTSIFLSISIGPNKTN